MNADAELPSTDMEVLLSKVRGKRVLIVNDRVDKPLLDTLVEMYGFGPTEMMETKPRTNWHVRDGILKGRYDLVLAFTGFMGHKDSNILNLACRKAGVQYIAANKGKPTAVGIALARAFGLEYKPIQRNTIKAVPPTIVPKILTKPKRGRGWVNGSIQSDAKVIEGHVWYNGHSYERTKDGLVKFLYDWFDALSIYPGAPSIHAEAKRLFDTGLWGPKINTIWTEVKQLKQGLEPTAPIKTVPKLCQHQLTKEADKCRHGFHLGSTCTSCIAECNECATVYGRATPPPQPATVDVGTAKVTIDPTLNYPALLADLEAREQQIKSAIVIVKAIINGWKV